MSFWEDIYFWRKKKELEKIVIPYKPGYDPTVQPTKNIVTNMWEDLKPIDLAKIEVLPFADDQFFKEEYQKTQVVLHHTVSGNGIEGDISSWEADPKRVATCIIVDRAGTPWQLFSSKYWAGHLGAGNLWLDRHSIGIEIDNWGWLIPGNGSTIMFDHPQKPVKTELGKYYAYYGNAVAVSMQYYPHGFRSYHYYEKYTNEQIRTVGELILYWKLKYNIPVDYKSDMWDVSPNALGGKAGIWTHVSYRPASDKTDLHPQPEMIEMLKALDGIS
jgi:N-acetyl-anhydromuramyl-L-alanine amidase AmpD